jgi:hypothetical protein
LNKGLNELLAPNSVRFEGVPLIRV